MEMAGIGKAVVAVLTAVLAGTLFGEPSLLFRATFDGYNTAPDFAASGKVVPGGIQPDLQMRMDHGEPAMKNVLSLTNPEFVSYPMAGNFRPDRGTVGFWMKPANYTLSDVKNFQMFFTANAPGYEFYVYKYTQRPNKMMFYLRAGDVSKFVVGEAAWRAGDWHKVDATWDPNGLALYLDGRRAAALRHDAPVSLPLKLNGGLMALNRQEKFNPTVDGRETGYDGLEIYDRKLTAQEVFENYRKVRPDAKPDDSVNAEPEPPRLTYQCLPREKRLVVNLDIWSADLKSRENVAVKLALVSRKTGQPVVAKDVVFATPESAVDFAFGEVLKEGETYDLVAEIPAAKSVSKAKFHVPDMSFLKARAGKDGTVPPPWTPVKVEGEGVYSVNDRTYRFTNGILPSGIVCRGEEMLVEAPDFELDGEKVAWQPPRLAETHDDHVVLAAEGKVGTVAVRGRADLWFDGFCQLRIRFMPGAEPAEVRSLQLKWSVPKDAARYLLTPYYRAWQAGDRYDGVFGYDEYAKDQFLWTTGVEKGLCWWCESRANWVGDEEAKTLHVVRGADRADVTVDIIAKPCTLAKDADYTMGFQATPAKDPGTERRSHWYSASGSFGDWTTGGWGAFSGRADPDSMRNVTSYVPLDQKAFGDYVAKRKKGGMEILSYGMLSVVSVKDEPWDYFNAVWCRKPLVRESFRDLDKKTPVALYFGCANTGIGDWHVGNIENLFKTQPDLKGVYFDISDVKFCNNALHGHGGTDAFGKPYKTSTALSTRDYFLRVYKLCRRHNRWLHIHAHNKYYPFAHGFADACWPGEEQYYAFANDPANHYLEGIGEEEYQAAWNPVIRGMDVYLIPQNHRASDFGPHKGDLELFEGNRSVTAAMLPPLLYDFKELGGSFGKGNAFADGIFRKLSQLPLEHARFHGYWYDPHAEVAKGVRTALYTWEQDGAPGFLLVVGNTSRNDLKTCLKLDWNKAGTPPVALADLVSGETKTEAEWGDCTLRSHSFLALVPQVDAVKNRKEKK